MKKSLLIMLLTVTGGYGTVSAQKPAVVVSDKAGWHKIGETTVNFKKDRDEIMVLGANRFSAIKFKTKDAPIQIMSMEAWYESNIKDDIKVHMNIPVAHEGESIQLSNGAEHDLKRVVFVYKTMSDYKGDKGHVELWGLKTNAKRK